MVINQCPIGTPLTQDLAGRAEGWSGTRQLSTIGPKALEGTGRGVAFLSAVCCVADENTWPSEKLH